MQPERNESTCRWAERSLMTWPSLWLVPWLSHWRCLMEDRVAHLPPENRCAVCPFWEPRSEARPDERR